MGNEIYFDSVLGGYVKKDVIAKIDAYNKLINETCTGVERAVVDFLYFIK